MNVGEFWNNCAGDFVQRICWESTGLTSKAICSQCYTCFCELFDPC